MRGRARAHPAPHTLPLTPHPPPALRAPAILGSWVPELMLSSPRAREASVVKRLRTKSQSLAPKSLPKT